MDNFKKPGSAEPNTNFEHSNRPVRPGGAPLRNREPSACPASARPLNPAPAKPIEPTAPINPSQNTPAKPHKSTGLIIGLVCCAVAAVAGIGLGVYNLLQFDQLSSDLNSQKTALENTQKDLNDFKTSITSVVDDDTDTIDFKCTPPTSADDIWSIDVQNGASTSFIINPDSNEIDFTEYTTSETGEEVVTSRTIVTPATDVAQYIYDNALNDFIDVDYEQLSSDSDSLWYVTIDGPENSECMVVGQDTPPTWFNGLIDLLNTKKGN